MSKVDELKKELGRKKLEIKSLLEITRAINENKDAAYLFRIYMFILSAQQGLDKIALIAKPNGDEWELVGEKGINELQTIELKSLVEQIQFNLNVSTSSSGVNEKAIKASRIENFPLENINYVIPVFHKKEPLAYSIVSKRVNDENPWDKEQKEYLQTITNIIAVAVENKKLFKKQEKEAELRKEKELAAEIQQMLIPQALPEIEHLEMQAKYLPHSEVGGDYYDVIQKGNQLFLCIGDISGKGTPAALLMSNVQANVRALISESRTLRQIVRNLNARFVKITKGERFITFFIARLDLDTGQLNYVNAGHNHPVLIKNGKLQHLDLGCTILGVFDELPNIKEGKTLMAKDDSLFLYTDGLSDLENQKGEHFGEEQIDSILMKFQSYKLSNLLTKIERIIEKYRGEKPYYDDITYMAIKQTF
jgi:sigma-B regulation protein RsbU (phosphoserine phosphatase)